MLKELDPAYRSFDVLDDPKRIAFVSKPQNFFGRLKLVGLKMSHKLRHYDTIYRFLQSADIVMTEDIDPRKLSDRRFAREKSSSITLRTGPLTIGLESL